MFIFYKKEIIGKANVYTVYDMKFHYRHINIRLASRIISHILVVPQNKNIY